MSRYVSTGKRIGKSAALDREAQAQANERGTPVTVVGPRGRRDVFPQFVMTDHDEVTGAQAWAGWEAARPFLAAVEHLSRQADAAERAGRFESAVRGPGLTRTGMFACDIVPMHVREEVGP